MIFVSDPVQCWIISFCKQDQTTQTRSTCIPFWKHFWYKICLSFYSFWLCVCCHCLFCVFGKQQASHTFCHSQLKATVSLPNLKFEATHTWCGCHSFLGVSFPLIEIEAQKSHLWGKQHSREHNVHSFLQFQHMDIRAPFESTDFSTADTQLDKPEPIWRETIFLLEPEIQFLFWLTIHTNGTISLSLTLSKTITTFFSFSCSVARQIWKVSKT